MAANGTQYIFRFNKKDYLNSYQKEWYCISQARKAGIPTSEVFSVGTEGEFAYMVLDYVQGENGLDVPEEKRGEILSMLEPLVIPEENRPRPEMVRRRPACPPASTTTTSRIPLSRRDAEFITDEG